MRQIRVFVAGMTAFHVDILRRIVGEQTDMTIVGAAADRPPGAVVAELGTDVLVVGGDHHGVWLDLIWQHPGIRIVALDESGRRASPIEMRHLTSTGAGWSADVVDAVRNAAGP